jgi:hypothetical protein
MSLASKPSGPIIADPQIWVAFDKIERRALDCGQGCSRG